MNTSSAKKIEIDYQTPESLPPKLPAQRSVTWGRVIAFSGLVALLVVVARFEKTNTTSSANVPGYGAVIGAKAGVHAGTERTK